MRTNGRWLKGKAITGSIAIDNQPTNVLLMIRISSKFSAAKWWL
jgi:hypothetical protein